MKLHKEFCKSCRRPIKGDECNECHQIWKHYVTPANCMYCNEIGNDFCLPCKSGHGGTKFHWTRLKEEEIIRRTQQDFNAMHIRRMWQIATFSGKSKKYGLEKREYLMRTYTHTCKCRRCAKRKKIEKGWNNKGRKKREQRIVYEDEIWWKNPPFLSGDK